MADIDVVPKKRTSTWLWIIAAIVVALIVWAIIAANSGAPDRVGVAHPPAIPEVASFVGAAAAA